VLVRQALVAAPAQARPDLHGTSFRRCRRHEVSVTADAA
jgi:hypothetical protein